MATETEYVLDASAVARLFLDQPGAREFEAWYHDRSRERCRFFAPDILPYELANILHRELGATPRAQDPEFMVDVVRSGIQGIEIHEHGWTRTWPWAPTLSAYDAAYAALASVKQATLVTYDRHLAQVAAKKVPVIGLDGLETS